MPHARVTIKLVRANGFAANLRLFVAIKETLDNMVSEGGRDTEKDLLGNPGGYHCILSKNTCHELCPRCGGKIIKEAYLGGSIYYCRDCQTI